MKSIIVVAGATGNLGSKIVTALLQRGANVKALIRKSTTGEKVDLLTKQGVEICTVDFANMDDIQRHCAGADCVVSVLAGLRDVIVDTQTVLLQGAVNAGVPRFIPSDFCSDYTHLIPGDNRNLDFRREFKDIVDAAPIQATSIMNGAFMELLTTDMPLILSKQKRILAWGDSSQKMEFTHTLDVAQFTAAAAMDAQAPRILKIAGAVMSSQDFVTLLTDIKQEPYKVLRPGGIWLFNFMIKMTRFFSPGKDELYPAWQGMQYMRDMMAGRIPTSSNDNGRYSGWKWTSVRDLLD